MAWVYYNKIPIYPIFYLLKGDCKGLRFLGLGGVWAGGLTGEQSLEERPLPCPFLGCC